MLAHVVGADVVEVRVGGVVEKGEVRGADRLAGVAVLDVPTRDAPPVRWSPDVPEIGTTVYASADPGGTGLRVTEGRVSAAPVTIRSRSGRKVEVVEHTAPLPRGSGGGPLLDEDGAVLGVNALRGDPGFLLALPTALVKPAVDRLLDGRAEPGRLGVALAPSRAARRMRRAVGLPDRDGLLVRDVEPESPAAAAGVQPGDLLTGLAGTPLRSIDDLFGALQQHAGARGATTLAIVRGVEELEVAVDLQEVGA